MSIFKDIMSKIFPKAMASEKNPTEKVNAESAAPQEAATTSASDIIAKAISKVDVEAILEKMQASNSQKLNWKTSIVDLMKLLGLDSSLTARKQLAAELNYTGDTNDSATMNIWLHKVIMQKIAENGGTLPDSIKH